MIKYPRTCHIEGSRLQYGDELDVVPFKQIEGKTVVIEEKLDGANTGISFDNGMHLQSRGHYLSGGPREKQFNLFKAWATARSELLKRLLGEQYIMYGEWMYAKHTVFYDKLPHYFIEFDILDKQSGKFLSTNRRHKMLKGWPIISVPVLSQAEFGSLDDITRLARQSLFKSNQWLQSLEKACPASSFEQVKTETDLSDLAEGIYIKIEDDHHVLDRCKFVRSDFSSAVLNSETHWMNRPIIANQLASNVDIWC
jgi:hypothetical protein